MATSGDMIARQYGDFKGVDFGNDPGMVSLSRSPDALNVWRNYSESNGTCIQTRPGYKRLGKIGNRINSFFVFDISQALVHSGTNLYLWSNFPDEPEITLLNSNMNNRRSFLYKLGNNVYINDGKNYLVYKNGQVSDVANDAYVPTTTIGRKPSGGGKIKDDVNLLTSNRKNTFQGDGSSKVYYLDTTNITTVLEVKVNGVTLNYETDWKYNTGVGSVTFTTAPSKPSVVRTG